MATFTASLQSPNLKAVHAGLQTASNVMTFTGTATASSVFLLVRVPNGARIVDYKFWATDQATNQTYDLGILQPEGSTSGSVTFSQSAIESTYSISSSSVASRKNFKLPYKVSISGEANPKWAWVTAVNSAATSASALMSITVFYEMDYNP